MIATGCTCCKGKGQVLSIEGQPRPCSRCRVEAFELWCRMRRDGFVIKPITPAAPNSARKE